MGMNDTTNGAVKTFHMGELFMSVSHECESRILGHGWMPLTFLGKMVRCIEESMTEAMFVPKWFPLDAQCEWAAFHRVCPCETCQQASKIVPDWWSKWRSHRGCIFEVVTRMTKKFKQGARWCFDDGSRLCLFWRVAKHFLLHDVRRCRLNWLTHFSVMQRSFYKKTWDKILNFKKNCWTAPAWSS